MLSTTVVYTMIHACEQFSELVVLVVALLLRPL